MGTILLVVGQSLLGAELVNVDQGAVIQGTGDGPSYSFVAQAFASRFRRPDFILVDGERHFPATVMTVVLRRIDRGPGDLPHHLKALRDSVGRATMVRSANHIG